MSSHHLVDPELRPLLEVWPDEPLTEALLPATRARTFPFPPVPLAALQAVKQERRRIPGPAGAPDVPVAIYRPPVAGPVGCILHIHGGGFVSGSAESLAALHIPLVHELGCVIVSVDYRLAPETVFPGAIEDVYAALGWLFAEAAALGVDPARIGVMGESAGGGLAAALALLARDRGDYRLAFQHLIYPMLDDRTCVAAEPNTFAGDFIWTPQRNLFGWHALLGEAPGGADVSPYAAPARASDLSGLPPTFLSTAALDLFIDEDLDYAQRLIRAGVPTELHVYPGAYHGFDVFTESAVARRAGAESREALRRVLA